MKKETVTTTQPDGTVVTKTTETRTTDSSYDDSFYFNGGRRGGEYEIEEMEVNCIYCCTPLSTLRLTQIIVSFIIIGCVTGVVGAGSFRGILSGHIYVLVICCLCVCITFTFLIAYLFGFHRSILRAFPWKCTDLTYSALASVSFFIAGCLEAWYASGRWGNGADFYILGWTQCRRSVYDSNLWDCPVYIPWIIAAVLCFFNCILYAFGACLAFMGKHYL